MIKSNFKVIMVALLGVFLIKNALAEDNYELPVGVPDPITTWIPDGYKGNLENVIHPIWGKAPVSWEVAKDSGSPAYYIDSSSPNATNYKNEFGSPDKPRNSIPEITYEAGSYVEIHGGPYSGGGQIILRANGTVEQPVWIKGASYENMPEIRGETIVKGQYIFFENLNYTEIYESIQLRPHQGSTLHHVVVRNSVMKGTGSVAGRNASAIIAYGESSDNRFHDIIIYNNDISYFGDSFSDDDPTAELTEENDYHGIGIPKNIDRAWVLKNHIHHMGGDSIQVGTASTDDINRVSNIYVGDNDFHDNLENGVDVKEADNTVITSNNIYNFFQHAGNLSTGVAVVIHNDAYNTWLINNRIHNSASAIEHTGGLDVWIVGNIIESINHPSWASWNTESVYSRGAGIHLRGISTGGAVNNTIVGTDKGITMASGGNFLIANNIIANRNEKTGYDIHIESTTSPHIVSNNLSYHPEFSVNFKNVNCNNCLEDNPSFIDEIYQTSIDAAGVGAGYSFTMIQNKFKESFGESLDVDILGGARVKGTIDIGAVENQDSNMGSSTVEITLPTAPSILDIAPKISTE